MRKIEHFKSMIKVMRDKKLATGSQLANDVIDSNSTPEVSKDQIPTTSKPVLNKAKDAKESPTIGVNAPMSGKKGVSLAGHNLRNKHKEDAINAHKTTLDELEAMPKPNLTKADGSNPNKAPNTWFHHDHPEHGKIEVSAHVADGKVHNMGVGALNDAHVHPEHDAGMSQKSIKDMADKALKLGPGQHMKKSEEFEETLEKSKNDWHYHGASDARFGGAKRYSHPKHGEIHISVYGKDGWHNDTEDPKGKLLHSDEGYKTYDKSQNHTGTHKTFADAEKFAKNGHKDLKKSEEILAKGTHSSDGESYDTTTGKYSTYEEEGDTKADKARAKDSQKWADTHHNMERHPEHKPESTYQIHSGHKHVYHIWQNKHDKIWGVSHQNKSHFGWRELSSKSFHPKSKITELGSFNSHKEAHAAMHAHNEKQKSMKKSEEFEEIMKSENPHSAGSSDDEINNIVAHNDFEAEHQHRGHAIQVSKHPETGTYVAHIHDMRHPDADTGEGHLDSTKPHATHDAAHKAGKQWINHHLKDEFKKSENQEETMSKSEYTAEEIVLQALRNVKAKQDLKKAEENELEILEKSEKFKPSEQAINAVNSDLKNYNSESGIIPRRKVLKVSSKDHEKLVSHMDARMRHRHDADDNGNNNLKHKHHAAYTKHFHKVTGNHSNHDDDGFHFDEETHKGNYSHFPKGHHPADALLKKPKSMKKAEEMKREEGKAEDTGSIYNEEQEVGNQNDIQEAAKRDTARLNGKKLKEFMEKQKNKAEKAAKSPIKDKAPDKEKED